ncbi:MAG: enoyl-CoA hydratase-related protein [Dehalococcoidales bacterium]|nr:enoyl-CoA hydratase-related protein [Dehalococcoidales bacterium]
MDYQAIKVEQRGHITLITLNRPERLNAVSEQLEEELYRALSAAEADDEVRVVVLTGAGKAFCAGVDTSRLPSDAPMKTPEQERRGVRGLQRNVLKLHRMEKPTIAMVNGAAVGGGFDLACGCDIRIGSPNTRFMVAFTRVGLTPGWGGAWLLPRIVGYPKAAELIFAADFCEAEEALRIGLLNKLAPAEALEKETIALAERIANGPPIGIRLSKIQLQRGQNTDFETELELAAALETCAAHTFDAKEGAKAFSEKRKPEYKGK